jgi:hypothetical protein
MKTNHIKLALIMTGVINLSTALTAYVPKTGDNASDGGKEWPTNRFMLSGDCVTDKLTGLVWTKSGSQLGDNIANINDAKTTITNMNINGLCGYKDWRLPNVNELNSLVNYSAFKNSSPQNNTPALWLMNTAGFINVCTTFKYWTSTIRASNLNEYWVLDMSDALLDSGWDGAAACVWPVRGGK